MLGGLLLLVAWPVRQARRSPSYTTGSVPGARSMYSSDLAAALRFSGLAKLAGSGMRPVIGTASSGLVPQVTMGAMAAPSISTSRSKGAPSSSGRMPRA